MQEVPLCHLIFRSLFNGVVEAFVQKDLHIKCSQKGANVAPQLCQISV